MKQMITKEQLAKNYGKEWLGSETAWAAAKCGFEAGWDARQQLLQQTQCTTHVCPRCRDQHTENGCSGYCSASCMQDDEGQIA